MSETLKDTFKGKERADTRQQQDVPERIKKHAPQPELKPDGSWRARADAVDRAAREKQQARKARNEWAKRLNESLRHGKGFNRRAR